MHISTMSNEFENLCDDSFARVVSFLDFQSAIVASKLTSKRICRHITSTPSADIYANANANCGNSVHHSTQNVRGCDRCDDNDNDDNNRSYRYSHHCFQTLWRELYRRQLFPPLDYYKELDGIHYVQEGIHRHHLDYIRLCKKKRKLFQSLMQERKRTIRKNKKIKSCFSIPNRCFLFLPIQPKFERDGPADVRGVHVTHNNPDTPPVDFMCSSYMLTSLSTGTEYVFLDPFDGSLSVHSNIMDHVLPKITLQTADVGINFGSESRSAERKEVETNAEVKRKSETLFSVQDYFELDPQEYFQHLNPRQNQGHTVLPNDPPRLHEFAQDDDMEVCWMGIDVHAIIDADENMVGNLVFAARELCVDNNDSWGVQDPVRVGFHSQAPVVDNQSCTELLAWKKLSQDGTYGNHRYTCRVDGVPYFIEACGAKEVVYMSFPPGRSNLYDHEVETNHLILNDDADDDDNSSFLDDNGLAVERSHQIHIFPFLPNNDSGLQSKKRRYFPDVQNTISCCNLVSSFVCEPAGNHLVVGTDNGTVEIWNVDAAPRLRERIDIRDRIRNMVSARSHGSKSSEHYNEIDDEIILVEPDVCNNNNAHAKPNEEVNHCRHNGEDQIIDLDNPFTDHRMPYACALSHLNETIQNEQDTAGLDGTNGSFRQRDTTEHDDCEIMALSQCKLNRPINHIFLPKHLPIQKAGFVSMQHHKSEGTTLMLWQHGKNGLFQIESILNLPLSTQRRPQVAYDGKRLVVFGQDHIGLIILVYRVMSSPDDFQTPCGPTLKRSFLGDKKPEEVSGGVVNLTKAERIVYVQRIRHAGLGGFEYYDNIFMTLNERFIVVNTKTGNLLHSSEDSSNEGLIVIDLEQY